MDDKEWIEAERTAQCALDAEEENYYHYCQYCDADVEKAYEMGSHRDCFKKHILKHYTLTDDDKQKIENEIDDMDDDYLQNIVGTGVYDEVYYQAEITED